MLGVLAELAGHLPHPWMYLSQVILVWLAGAFASGATARTTGLAALAGTGFIVSGLVSNTAFKAVLDGPVAVRPMLEHEWPPWSALAVVLGSSSGLGGRVRVSGSDRARAAAAGALLAAGVAEVGADLTGILLWGQAVGGIVAVAVALSAVPVQYGFRARQVTVAPTDRSPDDVAPRPHHRPGRPAGRHPRRSWSCSASRRSNSRQSRSRRGSSHGGASFG